MDSIETYSENSNNNIIKFSNIDKILTLFLYKGTIRELLVSAKFSSNIVNTAYLGKIIMSEIDRRQINISSYDFILPVPMNKKHYKKRKFNQLELFLREISKKHKIPPIISGEKINSVSQVGLNALERVNNIKGTFIIENSYNIENKTVLIFDDVITTGATGNEIAGILKNRGAKKVDLLTCCHGEL